MSVPEQRLRLVVLDDDAAQLDILQLMLRNVRPDWEILVRHADEAFLAEPQLPPVDIVLADYILGDRRATDLFQEGPRPVLVVSGADDPDTRAACQAGGLFGPCAKPYDLSDVQALCRRIEEIVTEASVGGRD